MKSNAIFHVTARIIEDVFYNFESPPVFDNYVFPPNIMACDWTNTNPMYYWGTINFYTASNNPSEPIGISCLPTCPKCAMLLEEAMIWRGRWPRT